MQSLAALCRRMGRWCRRAVLWHCCLGTWEKDEAVKSGWNPTPSVKSKSKHLLLPLFFCPLQANYRSLCHSKRLLIKANYPLQMFFLRVSPGDGVPMMAHIFACASPEQRRKVGCGPWWQPCPTPWSRSPWRNSRRELMDCSVRQWHPLVRLGGFSDTGWLNWILVWHKSVQSGAGEKIKETQWLSAFCFLESTWQSATPAVGVMRRGFCAAGNDDQAGAKWDRWSIPQ